MEIPVIGKLFRQSKSLPESTPGPSHEIAPHKPAFRRARINREVIGENLARRSGDKEALIRATDDLVEVTKEALEELLQTESRVRGERRFVRGGDRMAMSTITPHVYCALAAGLKDVDDAGYISRDFDHLEDKTLFISKGSEGLHIGDANENRPATVDLLRKIAPDIKFEEKIPDFLKARVTT